MIFGRSDKPEHHRVYIDNIVIERVNCNTFLGVTIISYCCEIWGNTYKTRIQPLYIIQKRAMRICNHLEYRSHSKLAFFKLKSLTIADLVKFKSMVLMYKISPVTYFLIFAWYIIIMSHAHDTRQTGHFKNM